MTFFKSDLSFLQSCILATIFFFYLKIKYFPALIKIYLHYFYFHNKGWKDSNTGKNGSGKARGACPGPFVRVFDIFQFVVCLSLRRNLDLLVFLVIFWGLFVVCLISDVKVGRIINMKGVAERSSVFASEIFTAIIPYSLK